MAMVELAYSRTFHQSFGDSNRYDGQLVGYTLASAIPARTRFGPFERHDVSERIWNVAGALVDVGAGAGRDASRRRRSVPGHHLQFAIRSGQLGPYGDHHELQLDAGRDAGRLRQAGRAGPLARHAVWRAWRQPRVLAGDLSEHRRAMGLLRPHPV